MIDGFLFVLVLLQIKHWYIDFVNQSTEEVHGKGIYGNWQGIKHSLKHGIATAFIFFLTDIALSDVILLGILDFVIHYHIDWTKININKKHGYTVEMPQFWAWLGADQLAHQLTYIAMIGLLL
jgi:hypothetical protein